MKTGIGGFIRRVKLHWDLEKTESKRGRFGQMMKENQEDTNEDLVDLFVSLFSIF